jgi:haloacetate dehalogenase
MQGQRYWTFSGDCDVTRRALLLASSAAFAHSAAAEAVSQRAYIASTNSASEQPGRKMSPEAALNAFEYRRVTTSGASINVATSGKGPPLLLLHGYPETHLMWRNVAPALAQDFTVICADLRGYGDSSKPEGTPDHANYSKRAMAQDMVEVMAALGHDKFLIAGHDRGARVAYRLALDHPGAVERLALLDIVSTKAIYEQVTMSLASAYFHWYFLIQPQPLPETLIGHDPEFWLKMVLGRLSASGANAISESSMREYLRSFGTREGIHAVCEDYRAGATVDLAHDRADVSAGRKIVCATLILWGSRGVIGRNFQPLKTWLDLVASPTGQAIDSGHFIPEENPEETVRALRRFFRS